MQLDLFTLVNAGPAVENGVPVNELTPESGTHVGFADVLQSATSPEPANPVIGVASQNPLPADSVLPVDPLEPLLDGEAVTGAAIVDTPAGSDLPVELLPQSPAREAMITTTEHAVPLETLVAAVELDENALDVLEYPDQPEQPALLRPSEGVAETASDGMLLNLEPVVEPEDETATRVAGETAQQPMFDDTELSVVPPLDPSVQGEMARPANETVAPTGPSPQDTSDVNGVTVPAPVAGQATSYAAQQVPVSNPVQSSATQLSTPQAGDQAAVPVSNERPQTTAQTPPLPAIQPASVQSSVAQPVNVSTESDVTVDETVLVPRMIDSESTRNRGTRGVELPGARELYVPAERAVTDARAQATAGEASPSLVMERLLQADVEPKTARQEPATTLLANPRADNPQGARAVPVISSTVDVWVRTPGELPEQVMQQVNRLHADALRMTANGGDFLQRVTLNLWPQELGPIEVQLRAADQVSVSFNAREATTRELLEQGVMRLRQLFDEQGLNLGDVDVGSDWSAQSGGENGQDHTDSQAGETRLPGTILGDDANDPTFGRRPQQGDNSLYIIA